MYLDKLLAAVSNNTDASLVDQWLRCIENMVQKSHYSNDAETVCEAVEKEFKRRRDNRINDENKRKMKENFRFIDIDSPSVGMLVTLGYHVGDAKGKTSAMRRAILDKLLNCELPFVHSVFYINQWGVPDSHSRYYKIVRTLELLRYSKENSPYYNHRAIKEYSDDLDYFRQKHSARFLQTCIA